MATPQFFDQVTSSIFQISRDAAGWILHRHLSFVPWLSRWAACQGVPSLPSSCEELSITLWRFDWAVQGCTRGDQRHQRPSGWRSSLCSWLPGLSFDGKEKKCSGTHSSLNFNSCVLRFCGKFWNFELLELSKHQWTVWEYIGFKLFWIVLGISSLDSWFWWNWITSPADQLLESADDNTALSTACRNYVVQEHKRHEKASVWSDLRWFVPTITQMNSWRERRTCWK